MITSMIYIVLVLLVVVMLGVHQDTCRRFVDRTLGALARFMNGRIAELLAENPARTAEHIEKLDTFEPRGRLGQRSLLPGATMMSLVMVFVLFVDYQLALVSIEAVVGLQDSSFGKVGEQLLRPLLGAAVVVPPVIGWWVLNELDRPCLLRTAVLTTMERVRTRRLTWQLLAASGVTIVGLVVFRVINAETSANVSDLIGSGASADALQDAGGSTSVWQDVLRGTVQCSLLIAVTWMGKVAWSFGPATLGAIAALRATFQPPARVGRVRLLSTRLIAGAHAAAESTLDPAHVVCRLLLIPVAIGTVVLLRRADGTALQAQRYPARAIERIEAWLNA